jgi:nucleoside-diphosphate-sugar epimerase
MKILVTGGLGTISRYITRLLDKAGHEVILLNHNQQELNQFKNVRVILGDRKNPKEFVRICREIGPFDCVYDQICFTPEEGQSAIDAFAGNTKQLIFCSTVDVYTKMAKRYPIHDDAECCPLQSFPYAYMKRQIEEMLLKAHAEGKFSLTILRPGHTYSEESPRSNFIFGVFAGKPGANFHLDRIKKGKPVILQGDGVSIWNLTHGADSATAFVGALGNKKTYGKAYTVVGDEAMPYTVYFSTVAEIMGAPPIKFVHIPSDLLRKISPEKAWLNDENFKYNNIFDNSAAKNDLGFTQKIKWPEGIKRCLDIFGDKYENSDAPEFAYYDKIIESYNELFTQLVNKLGKL